MGGEQRRQSHTLYLSLSFSKPTCLLVSFNGHRPRPSSPHRPHPHFMDLAAVEFAQRQGQNEPTSIHDRGPYSVGLERTSPMG